MDHGNISEVGEDLPLGNTVAHDETGGSLEQDHAQGEEEEHGNDDIGFCMTPHLPAFQDLADDHGNIDRSEGEAVIGSVERDIRVLSLSEPMMVQGHSLECGMDHCDPED